MKVRLTDKWIYIIAVINSLLLILIFGVRTHYDTTSYIDAWNNSWSKGVMDIFRTPVYPTIIGLTKAIFGTHFMLAIVIIQHIVFIVSIYYFRKIVNWEIKSKKVAFWITLLYILLPATASWANSIMTELFALTGAVFLFYNIFAFQQINKLSNICWCFFWFVFLLFLRPACLYLFPVMVLVWILFYKYHKFYAILGISGVLIVGILELSYCNTFKNKYGIFAVSSVNTINQSWDAFENGLMKPSYTDNVNYKTFISKYNDSTIYSPILIDKYGLATVQKSIANSKNDQKKEWIKYSIMNFCNNSQSSLFYAYTIKSISVRHLIGLSFHFLYLFILGYFIVLLAMTIQKKRIYRSSLILWTTVVGNLLILIIGTKSDWGRLIVPSLPIVLIMFGQAFNYIKFNINGNTKKTQIE